MNDSLLTQLPIIIYRDDSPSKAWRAEISDSYEYYKPAKFAEINFDDISFHFRHPIEPAQCNHLLFQYKQDAIAAAKYVNKTYLGGKAKIWFI